MKCVLLLLAVCAIAILNVECTPVQCTEKCDRKTCNSDDSCRCGTFLDRCGCCSICMKCPGEECYFVRADRCTDGYVCKHTEPQTVPAHFNVPRVCLPKEE